MRRALTRATDLRTVWRLQYNLAPTDPRYLDATEEQVLEDLLVLLERHEAARREDDPRAAAEEEARSPAAARKLLALKERYLRDTEALERLRAFASGGTTPKAVPRSIVLRRRRGPTEPKKP